jgi:hypothetical protein
MGSSGIGLPEPEDPNSRSLPAQRINVAVSGVSTMRHHHFERFDSASGRCLRIHG